MPIVSRADADEVGQLIARVFGSTADQRSSAARSLFVEVMDFDASYGTVSLANAASGVALPEYAERVAELEGVHVVFVQLDTTETDRVRKADASEAARLVASQLGDDILLVFVNTSGSQLHFIHPSFVGSRPTLRRMVVERDMPRRTAVQQVSNIYWRHRDTGSVRVALEESFDVEPVTKRFFAEYQRVFDHAMDRVEGFGDGAEEQESKKLFVQTLFDRLMFVYFLQRKGWLVFRGRKDYLEAFWEDHCNRDDSDDFGAKNFHYDRLRLLFFGGLNNYQSQDVTSDPTARNYIGEVPFLNGGLFEETADEKNRKGMNGTKVPDECIEEIFDKLFGRFNFTVMESTPFDIEVAVDPEMLGKVFEELVTGRHESGSYYTPRAVVSFMCREALKGYLGERMPSLGSEVIASFVDDRETSGISLAAARGISSALDDFSVIDPACGSGAYLLGMMQELVDLHTALYSDRLKSDARDVYALKLHIIQRNLYGVDVDEFAVNIAMLRLWLSLAIEYDGDTPEPLPNLDFEIVRGDSLLGPDPSGESGSEMFRFHAHGVGERIAGLKAKYMRAFGPEKAVIKRDIEREETQLRETLGGAESPAGSVDWRIEFAEVFARGGFDAVVANPPYVVVKDSQLRAMYKEGVYGRMNLYGLFIQRSLQLMSGGSQLLFINPRTLLTDRYFTNLRKVIKQKTKLRGVVLIADRHNTFDRVLQECIILHLSRNMDARPQPIYSVNTRAISVPTDLNDRQRSVSISSDKVLLGKEYDDSFYIGESEFDYEVFERMNSVGVKLSHFGIKAETGKIQFDKYRKHVIPAHAEGASRLIWAENIQRYTQRESVRRTGKEWLDKSIKSAIRPNIISSGIVTQRVFANEQPRRIISTLILPHMIGADDIYSENHTNFISINKRDVSYEFILAVLNSSMTEYIFRRLNSNTQVSSGEINKLLFPPIPDPETLTAITTLVNELLNLGGVDIKSDAALKAISCERRLDQLIGSLYGFSPTEVKMIQTRLPSYERVYGVENDHPSGLSSLLDAVERIRESVPKSEWAKLPADGAANYKHYLYGHPKDDE